MGNDLAEAAAGYAAGGWAVFPCRTKTKFPNGALAPQGVRNASADPATLAAWWTRSPGSNIGLACGPISGVAVVDIDVDTEKGIDGFRSLREMGVELPETVQQVSPRGGAHYIYAITGEPPANKNSFRPGIDIRCDGYYILLAPSIHPNGQAYAWAPGHAPGEIELAPFPDFMRPEAEKKPAAPPPWLQPKRSEAPAAPRKPVAASGRTPIHERARLYLQSCDAAIQGLAGHDKLLWAATAMVHGFLLSDQDALQLLASEYNPRCVPPWNLDEAKDRKDFERKVSQARGSRHTKPAGWLLDEYGLREPGGNAEGAAMQQALLSGMPPAFPADDDDEPADDSDIEESEDEYPIPPDLLQPTGGVGLLAGWINSTSRKAQPILALGAALAFCGALFGRKVRDEWNLRTNLYCLGVAPTCAGKEHARAQIKRLCERAGVRQELLGGEDVTSDAAIEIRLSEQPSLLYLWDEIGHMISGIKSTTSTHLAKVVPALMKFYTSAGSVYIGKEYADGTRRDIVQPCCCLYGTTVPSTLYRGLTTAELRDGFVGRLAIFPSTSDPEPDDERAKIQEVPDALVQFIQAWTERSISAPAGTPNIEAASGCWQITVPTLPQAQARFLDFRAEMTARKRRAERSGNGTDCLYGRAEELARKYALILSCGDRFDSPEIMYAHADTACRLVQWQVTMMVRAIEAHVADNTTQAEKQRLKAMIADGKKAGISQSELTRKTQSMSKRQREEYLADLVDADEIVRAMKGRKGYWFSRKYYKQPTTKEKA